MVDTKLYRPTFVVLLGIFLIMALWWVALAVIPHNEEAAHFWGAAYGLTALVGGLYGLFAARSWGFFKSYFGKAIIFLSAGLLLGEFGQLTFSYYNIVEKVAIPYPSIADIGFFGAVPLYIAGAFYLLRGLGVGNMLKKNTLKLVLGVLIPLVVLGCSYWLFLKEYDASEKDSLTVFLDFAYPLGQALYVSLALVVVLCAGRMLGGMMKLPVLLLLFAFVLQYAADFNFLYQTIEGSWTVSGYGDFLYLSAYFVMGASLIALNRGLSKAFASSKVAKEAA
jgi:hypothetical protein